MAEHTVIEENVDSQRNLVTSLINHYDPKAEVSDEYYSGLVDKYGDTDNLVTSLINHYDSKAEVTEEYLSGLYTKYGVKKKDEIGDITGTGAGELAGEIPSTTGKTGQELFDQLFDVEPSAEEKTAKAEKQAKEKEEIRRLRAEALEKQAETVIVNDKGEVIDFRLPTPEEAEALVLSPEEARATSEKQEFDRIMRIAFENRSFTYGNESYDNQEHALMKQGSQEIISNTLPDVNPPNKDYTETFDDMKVAMQKKFPQNPQFIEAQIRRTQKEILENEILGSMDQMGKTLTMSPEYFVTMGEVEMEKLKKEYRKRGFTEDVVDGVMEDVMESRRDDIVIENQIDVFKKEYPQFDDEKLGKFIFRNAVTSAETLFSSEEKQISTLNREIQELLSGDEVDYDKIAELQGELDELREGRLYDDVTGIRIDQEDREYEEQVLTEARAIQVQPNFRDQLRDGLTKSYLAHKRLNHLYLRENRNLRERFEPGTGAQRDPGKAYLKQESKVDALFALQQEARIKEDAWARLFLLNEDPAEAEKDLAHYSELFGKSLIQSILGSQAANSLLPVTQRERFDLLERTLAGEDIALTDEQKENIKRDFSEDVVETGGGLVGIVAQFTILNKAGAALKIPQAISFLRGGGRTANVAATLMEASLEEAKFGVIGGDPGAGATFYATQKALPDFNITGKYKNILNPIVNVLYKADIGMTTASNVSATVSAGITALEQDRDFKNVMKRQFGDLSDFQHHVLTELSVNWLFGIAHGKNPNEVVRKSKELSGRVKQVIEEFRTDSKRTPEEIGELEKFVERLDIETGQLEKGRPVSLEAKPAKPEIVDKPVDKPLEKEEEIAEKEVEPQEEADALYQEIEILEVDFAKAETAGNEQLAKGLRKEIEAKEADLIERVTKIEDAKAITQRESMQPKDIIGTKVDYQGIKGKIEKTEEGFIVRDTEGEAHLIEGGESGKDASELGIKVTKPPRLTIDEINETEAPIQEHQVDFDGATNKVSIYGKEYTYEKVNLNEEGEVVSVQVTDAEGKSKTIRNEDAVLEVEIQKELWEQQQKDPITVERLEEGIKQLNLEEHEPTTEVEARREEAAAEVQEKGPVEPAEEFRGEEERLRQFVKKYPTPTDKKFGYIQEPGKPKKDLTKSQFEKIEKEITGETEEEVPTGAPKPKEEPTPPELKRTTPEFETRDGKYIVTKTPEGLDVFNVKLAKSVPIKTEGPRAAVEEYKTQMLEEFKKGKRADIPEDVVSSQEVARIVAEESLNPKEVAEAFIDRTVGEGEEMTLEDAIGQTLIGSKVTADAFSRAGDPNSITPSIRRNYFPKKGEEALRSFDMVVERVKETAEGRFDDLDPVAMEQDIYDFIRLNPSGARSYFKGKEATPLVEALKGRFEELTGIELTREYADRLVEKTEFEKMSEGEQIDFINDTLSELRQKEIEDGTIKEFETRSEREVEEFESTVTDLENQGRSAKTTEQLEEVVAKADELLAPKPKPTTEAKLLKVRDKRADALDRLATAIGAKRAVIGEEKPDAIKALQDITETFFEEFGIRGEELYKRVRDYIKDKIDPKFLEDNRKEIMGDMDVKLEPAKKERAFPKRVAKTEDLSEEVRTGFSEKGKFYIPIKNIETLKEAEAIVDIKGEELALGDVKNTKNDLSPANRVTISEVLIRRYNELGDKAESEAEKTGFYEKSVETAEFISEYGTELGQGIQAFSIWSKMNPEAMVAKYKKDLKKQDIELTPEQESKIRELTKKMQRAPEGFNKTRAIQDLLTYQLKIKGVNWMDVGMSVWYANILSGYSTHQLNFGANMMQAAGEIATSIVYNPKNTPYLLKGLYEGYGRGLFEAWTVLKTGYTPMNQVKFIETGKPGQADVMEAFRFKGGKFNPLNYYKFVRRAMMATDVFNFSGLKEMRSYELALHEARRLKKEQPDLDIQKFVSDRLLKTPERLKEAEAQARSEKLGKVDHRLRVYELMEQSRPGEMVEDADNFAAHGTFNYEGEGTLGLVTNMASKFAEAISIKGFKPVKFVIPFTRIVSNVANEYLDWTPWGVVRAVRGRRGIAVGEGYERFNRELTKEEQAKNFIKATLGTLAATTLWSLTDEDNGPFEITANGTGDYRKNYQLQEEGWQKYSIRIGDTWYSYANSPLAPQMTFIGHLRDDEKYRGKTLADKDTATKAGITAFNTAKSITDMTFLKGFSEFMAAFSEKNPEKAANYFQRFSAQAAKGFVIPNLVTQLSRSIQELNDAPMKEANGLIENIMRDLPYFRKGLKDKLNALGDPVIAETDRWIHEVEHDPLWNLINRNEAWIGKLNKGSINIYDRKIRADRKLTDDEYYEFSKLRGQLIKKQIEKRFKKLDKMTKSQVQTEIKDYKSKATKKAKRQLFGYQR